MGIMGWKSYLSTMEIILRENINSRNFVCVFVLSRSQISSLLVFPLHSCSPLKKFMWISWCILKAWPEFCCFKGKEVHFIGILVCFFTRFLSCIFLHITVLHLLLRLTVPIRILGHVVGGLGVKISMYCTYN